MDAELIKQVFIDVSYLGASVLFIFGLKGLTAPNTARRGMYFAEVGMALAIIGTLLQASVVTYTGILIGLVLGSLIGVAIAMLTPMTAMPERTALSHACGALAVTLVGVAEYYHHGAALGSGKMIAIGFEVLFGALTITGSLIAMGKLQGIIKGTPVTFKGQNAFNFALFFALIGMFFYLIFVPGQALVFYIMTALALVFGVLFVMPIGAADMPVVISLLNSYAGLAACATGFALGNNILIIGGALDGASGLILSIIMCKAMNRSITNVLFGAFGQVANSGNAPASSADASQRIRELKVDEAAEIFRNAQRVVIVPGYGLAVAQAQHAVREFADILKSKNIDVKYAIHPVAGRMPGHMNVLLAEANVPYDELVEMDDINSQFPQTDVSLVIGANDVVNPAAHSNPGSPIYGMPILEVDKSMNVIVLKRSMNPGFAGIENELFYNPKTSMVFGDAKDTMNKFVHELKHG